MKRIAPRLFFVFLACQGYTAEPTPTESREEIENEMSLVEPGFKPVDERAIQLYLLDRMARRNLDQLKSNKEEAQKIRGLFMEGYRRELSNYVDEKLSALEAQQKRSSDDLIEYLEKSLGSAKKPKPEDAYILYNLAWLYYDKDEKDYNDRLEAFEEARKEGKDDIPYPEENFIRSIDAYERLIKEFPKFPLMDQVLYLYGMSLWYQGGFYSAVDAFQRLIREYPNSRFVDEVWFRLGEFFYEVDEFDNAIDAYGQIVKKPSSVFYDKALYKIAWAHFQKNHYDTSIDYFHQVLELSFKQKNLASTESLRSEANRYIVKNINESMLAQEVKRGHSLKNVDKEYNEKLGIALVERVLARFKNDANKELTRELLIETASFLSDDAKIDGAILALEEVYRLDPVHQDNPKIDAQIAQIYLQADRPEDARARNILLIERYNKGSQWSAHQAGNFAALRVAREAVRDAMLSLAVYYHKTGKKLVEEKKVGESKSYFKEANELYLIYLNEYPEREDTYQAIFYLAESFYELGEYTDALAAYQQIKLYPLPIPGTIRRDATFNIVFTYKHVVEEAAQKGQFKAIDFDNLTSKFRGTTPEEIPTLGMEYLKAIDEFLRIAPEDPQVPVLLFHAGAIYYVYGHTEEALKRFVYILDTYPKTQAAAVSARLILDDAVSKEEWEKVRDLAKRFAEQNLGNQKGDFDKIKLNAEFKMARAVFESANELHKKGELTKSKALYKQSSQMYLDLLKADPKNQYADLMLFNAARGVAESGTSNQALPLYKRLYKEYPKSEYAKAARFQEALTYEKMLMFNEAALAYDGIIKEDPKSDAAADAMLNKALLYEAAEDLPKAAQAFLDFAKRYPDKEEASDALLTTAALYKRMGRHDSQIAVLEQFIKQNRNKATKKPAVIEAHVHIAETHEGMITKKMPEKAKTQHKKSADENYRAALKLYSSDLNSPVASFYAARAHLVLERPAHEEFLKMRIKGRTGKLQGEELNAMMKRLAELSAKNEEIIKIYAQPVSNAEALWRIGQLYGHLAESMLSAPCPNDVRQIDEFACDEYTILLQDKAVVLEEKALQAYKQAYEIAISAYDAPQRLVVGIQQSLNKLRPGEYQRVGNAFEPKFERGFIGEGRMLSTGRMASDLHPKEADPDVGKLPEEEPVKVEPVPVEKPTEEQKQPTPEEKPTEEVAPMNEEKAGES